MCTSAYCAVTGVVNDRLHKRETKNSEEMGRGGKVEIGYWPPTHFIHV